MLRALLFVLAGLSLGAGPILAGEHNLASGTAGTTRWEVTSPLSFMPNVGFVPITITATNPRGKPTTASYKFESTSYYGEAAQLVARGKLVVPAKQSASATHWVWRSDSFNNDYSREVVRCEIVTQDGSSQDSLTQSEAEGACVGVSTSLVGGSGISYSNVSAATFDPESLPADWRIFSSLQEVYLAPSDWDSLSPGVRDALRTWIGLGGIVYLSGGNSEDADRVAREILPNDAALGLFAHADPISIIRKNEIAGRIGNRGRGTVFAIGVSGADVPRSRRRYMYDDRETIVRGGFPLRDAFGRRDVPFLIICVLLIVFAIVVGPISLRLWAGPGQRHRLFFTTPIFSLSTAGILLLVMLFQDGLGVDGRRFTIIDLAPPDSPQPTALVYQEQFTRAGMVSGGGFPIEEGLLPMIPTDQRDKHAVLNNEAVGPWLSSRGDASLSLAGAIPIRWHVTHAGATDERLNLRVESPLAPFETAWFVDQNGLVWKWDGHPPTADGEISFVPAGREPSLVSSLFKRCSQQLRRRLIDCAEQPNQRNRFWALVSDGSTGARPTHPKIDWLESKLVLTSKVAPPSS